MLPGAGQDCSAGAADRRLAEFESLPLEAVETADVSPLAATNAECKQLILFGSDQNRTQEADGSIPFSSTESRVLLTRWWVEPESRSGARI
jgi:hypothetical protein